MKRILLNLTIWAALMLAGVWVNAKENPKTTRPSSPQASFKTEAGDCNAGLAKFDIEINNVRARLLTGGDMWWDLSSLPEYEVPKGNGTHPLCSIFAGALWISGLDAGGNLKVAAQRYRDYGNDYWPGPLDANGNIDQATCSQYDRFFNVFGADIAAAQAAFHLKGSSTTTADIPTDVLAWPAVGNEFLATDPSLLGTTFNITDNLAPFFDNDGNGLYDPTKGDYPVIPCRTGVATAYADQMTFYVFNDMGNIHSQTNGEAIGVQVNTLAFEFATSDNLNNMSFYNYEIVNKSSNACYQTYVSQWVDPDLGCFDNDYVGCDVGRALGICYNGTADDPDCAPENGYGTQLPIVGVEFFQGPLSDSAVNGVHPDLGMTSFCYFTGQGAASPAQSDPITAAQYRNFQTGFWGDGTCFEYGGSGYNSHGPCTKYCFPSDPPDNAPGAWSECQSANVPGDRRFVESSGPFTLTPGNVEFVTVGVPWLRPPGTGVGTCPSFQTTIGPVADEAKALFNTCFKLLDGPEAPTLVIRELANEVIINLVNYKGSNNYGESYAQNDGKTAQQVDLYLAGNGDSLYRFQGYLLYQVVNPQVAASDLSDPTKAQLVAECDIKDDGGLPQQQFINYVADAGLGGLLVPTLEATGSNSGIVSSFDVKNDLFAQGTSTQLVNNTTYYFCALAFAYNNYEQYNQAAPLAGGQITEYLPGRGNFNVYTAIPHLTDSRNNGTVLNSTWGQGTSVQRIEGQGNGGNNLELSPQTILNILNSPTSSIDTLTYLPNFDPIGFQVTDPVGLIESNFQVQFEDSFIYTCRDTLHALTASGHDTVIRSTDYVHVANTVYPVGDTIKIVVTYHVGPGDTTKTSIRTDTVASVQTFHFWRLLDMNNHDTINADRNLDRPYQQEIISYSGTEPLDYGFSLNMGTPLAAYTLPGNYITGLSTAPPRYVYGVVNSQSSIQWQDSTQQWLSFLANTSGIGVVTNWIRSGTTLNSLLSNSNSTKALAYCFDDNWYYTGGSPPSPPSNFDDSADVFNNILGGTWAPYCLTPNYSNKAPINNSPPYVYGPGFKWRNYAAVGYQSPPPQNTLDKLASVDVVITPDTKLWSQCVVFETGEDEDVNQGSDLYTRSAPSLAVKGAYKGEIRMAYSQDWHNANTRDYLTSTENTTKEIGRSWFPGYAINIETGQRLNIAFGESSDMGDQHGTDMLWDPTSNLYGPITFPGQIIPQLPYFGGKHFVYVMSTKYDGGQMAHDTLLHYYDDIIQPTGTQALNQNMYPFYRTLMWTCIPYLTPTYSFVSDGVNGTAYIPPTTVTVKLRVEKPYISALAVSPTPGIDSLPDYLFSTVGLGAKQNNNAVAKSALDEIKIVPNPYLAYSAYETTANSATVYVTNLPNTCTITIYSLDGTLIRTLQRAVGVNPTTNQEVETSSGEPITAVNVSTSVSWDLTNTAGVPIASGVYLFHIEAPGIGQTTLKWFGAVRPDNITNY